MGYSAPRWAPAWPPRRANPRTSLTVIPWAPAAFRASLTSSILNGLTIAVKHLIETPSEKRNQKTSASPGPLRKTACELLLTLDAVGCDGCSVFRPIPTAQHAVLYER